MIGMVVKNQPSHFWWFDNQNSLTPKRSPWLQSTLAELDHNTAKMLKLIEADADSFRQRAEMYYKKRPELIAMVEEFYRAHRSLAEKHDLIKSDSGSRALTTLRSSFSAATPKTSPGKVYDSSSEICFSDDSAESEVDDPDVDNDNEVEEEEECEVGKLRDEIARLKGENRAQQEALKEKDEEKREVIRHLSLAVDLLKEENVMLKKCLLKENTLNKKKRTSFDFNKLKEGFLGKLFSPVVAL